MKDTEKRGMRMLGAKQLRHELDTMIEKAVSDQVAKRFSMVMKDKDGDVDKDVDVDGDKIHLLQPQRERRRDMMEAGGMMVAAR